MSGGTSIFTGNLFLEYTIRSLLIICISYLNNIYLHIYLSCDIYLMHLLLCLFICFLSNILFSDKIFRETNKHIEVCLIESINTINTMGSILTSNKFIYCVLYAMFRNKYVMTFF